MMKTSLKRAKPAEVKSSPGLKAPLIVGVAPRAIPKSIICVKPSRAWLDGMEMRIDIATGFMKGVSTWGVSTAKIRKGLSDMLLKVA